MTNSLEIAAWDSDFFGYPIGKIRAEQISIEKLKALKEQSSAGGIKLVYLFADPSDDVSNHAAEMAGAERADQKVVFFMNTGGIPVSETDEHIELYQSSTPTPQLISLSIQSGLYSRYKLDPNFKNHEFERLYTAWVENSVNKKIADYTYVYKEENTVLGFVTLKIDGKRGQIGLIAVDEGSRGKSIGKKLVYAVINLLKQKQVTELDVATQSANMDACNFYGKIGFEVISRENIYHIWF